MFEIMVPFNDITVTVLSSALGFLHVIAFGREELESFRPHVAGGAVFRAFLCYSA